MHGRSDSLARVLDRRDDDFDCVDKVDDELGRPMLCEVQVAAISGRARTPASGARAAKVVRAPKRGARGWESLPARQLLNVRLCDLGLDLRPELGGTLAADCIARVQQELEERGLRARPHFWLSDEWASPDGIPGVSVPFYLAHPRLAALERSQMREVEGGTRAECLRLLRHEVGHAVQTAYRLHLRKRWREVFGPVSRPYPEHYKPDPTSRSYVLHLPGWYAQSHPAEDFAETFAVWLRPRSNWRRAYAGWPAFRKLEYVDELMRGLRAVTPPVRRRGRPYALRQLDQTLGEYYEAKRERYGVEEADPYDEELLELFGPPTSAGAPDKESAAAYLRRRRRDLVDSVCRFGRQDEVVVREVLEEMIARCRALRLRVRGSETEIQRGLGAVLTRHAAVAARAEHWIAV